MADSHDNPGSQILMQSLRGLLRPLVRLLIARGVTLPLLTGPNGLPVGVQIVGRKGSDARLLRTARWLAARVAEAGE